MVFLLLDPAALSGDAFGYVKAAQTIIDTGKLPVLAVQPRGYPVLLVPLVISGLEISLFFAFPMTMLAYQYHSTQEIGLVRFEFRHPGYYCLDAKLVCS